MPKPSSEDITQLLLEWRQGNHEALDELVPVVYEELRRQAHRYLRHEQKGNSLQTTALINEVYLRLLDCSKVSWQSRAHFFAITAQMMRRILVDYARSRGYRKRGGGFVIVALDQDQMSPIGRDPDLVALDDALDALAGEDERKSRVVELRFFGGLSIEETAEVLGVCRDTVVRDWKFAKAWLAQELKKAAANSPAERSLTNN
jgi:RNA polymerase sigma-70 factor, ECF subfamily